MIEPDGIRIIAMATTTAQTGVEMEALTAASIAALDNLWICMIDSSIVINRSEIAAHSLRPGQRFDYYSPI